MTAAMGSERIRQPAVAGRFYPGDAEALRAEVAGYLVSGGRLPRRAAGVMLPHAGYVYSGGVAGRTLAEVQVPPRVVVLGPNHTGVGARIAVARADALRIPGADVPVDTELRARILAEVEAATLDDSAHRGEHSIEVELPFLLAKQPALRVVPIVLGGLRESEAVALGAALHRAAEQVEGEVLVVASSDMSHYLSDRRARQVDREALAPLLAFDPGGLYRTVASRGISMCGFIPATAMLGYARAAQAEPPELIAYATSGDAFGERDRVVGYAGVIV